MNHWVWYLDFPEYEFRLEVMADFITTGFHQYRVDSLSLVPME